MLVLINATLINGKTKKPIKNAKILVDKIGLTQ